MSERDSTVTKHVDSSAATPSRDDRISRPPHGPAPSGDGGPGSRVARLRDSAVALGSKSYLFVVLIAVLVVGNGLSPYFLTSRNLLSVLITASVVSVLAVGQFTVIVTGGIDLSVGSVAALSSVVGAIMLKDGQPFVVAGLGALAVAALIGLINGVCVTYARITPFIVTLAMMSIARGIAYIVQPGNLVAISNQRFLSVFDGDLGALPSPVLIAFLVMLVAALVMAFTPFGRRLYAIGGNAEAARLSGLPVKRDVMSAYMVSALLAGLAGLMIAAQLTEGSAIVGDGYELNSIAAVVVGGASLFGGTGNPISAVVGGLTIGTILNIMDLLGVQAQPQLVVKGAVILVAVFFTSGVGHRLMGRLLQAAFQRVRRPVPAGAAGRTEDAR